MIKRTFIFSGICILISFVMMYLARNSEGFAQWYSTSIFPMFPSIFGRLFSALPFSVFEIGLLMIMIVILTLFVKTIWLVILRSPKQKEFILKSFCRSVCFISGLLLVFTLAGAVNYSRDSFAASYGLPVQDYTEDDLKILSNILIEDIKELSNNIEINESGLLNLDKINLEKESIQAMENLGTRYQTLSGYYPRPKPVYFSKGMSYLGITGIYSPFTLEANYNRDVASFVIPYTICHELAHLKGYMKEEDANFIAYLACRDSNSNELKYSGTVNALIYTLNALYKNVSNEEFMKVYNQIPLQVQKELDQNRNYWKQHTANITTIAKAANDQYLIVNAQTQGTKSYGKIVDLLLAEYADVIKDSELL